MVSSSTSPIMRIPDAVYPPIPGESHRYYGNIHKNQVKLPSNGDSAQSARDVPRLSETDSSVEHDLDIHEAAAAGNMNKVKEILDPRGSGETTSSFLLANEPSSSSGLTPLHYAASRGHLDIAKWLIDFGAIVDLEDQTGETALLKASYNGHASIIDFLLQKQANVEQKDNDGWTALHNASSQGFLQIVKYLLEHKSANVNVKSNKGYTPLMNAASKGHIDIVEYFLNDGNANPLIKNCFGETAYDVAAASQEIYICELLEKAEREWWKGKRPLPQPSSFSELVNTPAMNQPYDIYSFHITVPVVIHENQRSSSAFGLSLRGHSKYSENNLLKSDIRGPWSLHPSGKPSSKEALHLPLESSSVSIISKTSSRSSHSDWFWVIDWQIDLTYPRVDSQGWQYAKSFDEPDGMWVSAPSNGGSWVCRRRWIRVMKRCMNLSEDGSDSRILQLVQDVENEESDYIKRAEAIIKKDRGNGKGKAVEISVIGQLAKYREAIDVLLTGIQSDLNIQRKQEATSLVNSFTHHAEYLDDMLKDTEASVNQPGPSFKDATLTSSISSTSNTPSLVPFKPDSSSGSQTSDIDTIIIHKVPSTASLKSFEIIRNPCTQGEEYQPSTVSPIRASPHLGLTIENVPAHSLSPWCRWENDSDVHECRRCRKKFGILFRRHHCRRCGQVVCDRCSTARVTLPPTQVLSGPSGNGDSSQSSQRHRVCDSCFTLAGYPARQRSSSFISTTSTSGSGESSSNHRRMSNSSNSSTMAECPVCNMSLNKIPGGKPAHEEHIKDCFENKNGSNVSGYKYVGEQVAF